MARSFRARRSMARSFRAHRSCELQRVAQGAQLQAARRAASGRVARWRAASGRVARSRAASGRVARERSFRARRSMRAASGRVARWRAASGRVARWRAASGRVARWRAASGRVARCRAASGRVARWRAASGRVVATSTPGGDRSFGCASLAHQSCGSEGRSRPSHQTSRRARDWLACWTDDHVKVRPWNDKAYQDLRQMIESLPPGAPRDQALDRIRSLDCANPDKTLASCDPSLPPPPEAAAWRKALEDARVDEAAYAKALAAELKTLVCSGDDDAAYVLRGLGFQRPPCAAGPEAPALVDFIMSKDCPVSASLTDADKANLLASSRTRSRSREASALPRGRRTHREEPEGRRGDPGAHAKVLRSWIALSPSLRSASSQ